MTRPPIDTFELETAAGFRRLTFVWKGVLRRRGWPAWRQSITGLAGVIAAFVVTYGAWILLVITIARRPNVEF